MLSSQESGGARGSVTAEFAIVLPAVTVLLAILLFSVAAGMLQIRLEEGARAGARALARGDSPAQVTEVVVEVAGKDATVTLGNSGGYATVTVQGRAAGVLSGLVPWLQSAQASARTETAGMPREFAREFVGRIVLARAHPPVGSMEHLARLAHRAKVGGPGAV